MTVDLATDPETLVRRMAEAARAAVDRLAVASTDAKNAALREGAKALRACEADILAANAVDIAEAERQGLSAAMRDRLLLNHGRLEAMAKGLEDIAGLADPV